MSRVSEITVFTDQNETPCIYFNEIIASSYSRRFDPRVISRRGGYSHLTDKNFFLDSSVHFSQRERVQADANFSAQTSVEKDETKIRRKLVNTSFISCGKTTKVVFIHASWCVTSLYQCKIDMEVGLNFVSNFFTCNFDSCDPFVSCEILLYCRFLLYIYRYMCIVIYIVNFWDIEYLIVNRNLKM